MEDPSAAYRANAIDHERAKTDAELDAIAHQVRSTQRHNLLLKIGVCMIPIGGCGGGLWIQTFDPHSLANAWLLGGGVGLATAVFLLKKYERPMPE
ncbi:MAG: hypothetical protein MUE69_31040 [Myxococcota bacterium]|nr:hypothetical protein [Myxococcota bacterium]